MDDLFIIKVPKMVVNEGGYIEDAEIIRQMEQNLEKSLVGTNNNATTSSQHSDRSNSSSSRSTSSNSDTKRTHINEIFITENSKTTELQKQDSSLPPILGENNSEKILREYLEFQAILQNVLVNDLDITHPLWTEVSSPSSSLEVKFSVPKQRTEFILNSLLTLGVGDRFGSIWVTPLDVSRPRPSRISKSAAPDQQFLETLKSRMIVEKVVELARASAAFSFDYVALVTVASTIALLGLAFNSVVAIVASMLVSPIMGPVVALTFGTIIKDKSLVRMGLWSELVSLAMCVGVGFVFGLCLVPFSSSLDLPTPEMESRGNLSGLVAGMLVAIPSGIGVALSILGNNTSSLVGVAISASLLPPAVNTGFYLAIAALANVYGTNDDIKVADSLEKSFISFSITMVNIVLIFIMALGMFKFKEVAPIPGKTRFWKDDVKMTRAYNGVLKGEAAANVANQLKEIMPSVIMNDPEMKSIASITAANVEENSLTRYVSMNDMRGGDKVPKQSQAAADLMSIFENPNEETKRSSTIFDTPAYFGNTINELFKRRRSESNRSLPEIYSSAEGGLSRRMSTSSSTSNLNEIRVSSLGH